MSLLIECWRETRVSFYGICGVFVIKRQFILKSKIPGPGVWSIEFLKNSQSTILMTDAYSGYERTVKEVNIDRMNKGLPLLKSGLCNDHSRRYFYQSQEHPLGERALNVYGEIYEIERKVQELIVKIHSFGLSRRSS